MDCIQAKVAVIFSQENSLIPPQLLSCDYVYFWENVQNGVAKHFLCGTKSQYVYDVSNLHQT